MRDNACVILVMLEGTGNFLVLWMAISRFTILFSRCSGEKKFFNKDMVNFLIFYSQWKLHMKPQMASSDNQRVRWKQELGLVSLWKSLMSNLSARRGWKLPYRRVIETSAVKITSTVQETIWKDKNVRDDLSDQAGVQWLCISGHSFGERDQLPFLHPQATSGLNLLS